MTNELHEGPRKGDVWKATGRHGGTATFLDNGDGEMFSVLLDGPAYFAPTGAYMSLAALVSAGFAPTETATA